MTETWLERLLVDRGLGEMEPDCSTLLEAYLELRPDTGGLHRDIEQTIDRARRALTPAEAVFPPALSVARLQRADTRLRLYRIARRVSAVAACLLLGFAARGLIRTAPVLPDLPQTPVVQKSDEARSVSGGQDGGFWSARRLYERATAVREQPAPRMIWRSPILLPQRGDST